MIQTGMRYATKVGTHMRIYNVLLALLVLIPMQAMAASKGISLPCTISIWQTQKATQNGLLGGNAVQLEPRTSEGQRFTSFPLDLQKVGDEAWLHQNLCIDRRDFRGGRFAGTLCVVVMTARESEENPSAYSLIVDVSRLAQQLGGKPQPLGAQSLGGLRVAVPVDTSGRLVSVTQFLPVSRGKRDLFQIDISCGT
jgi:hypothetical protein